VTQLVFGLKILSSLKDAFDRYIIEPFKIYRDAILALIERIPGGKYLIGAAKAVMDIPESIHDATKYGIGGLAESLQNASMSRITTGGADFVKTSMASGDVSTLSNLSPESRQDYLYGVMQQLQEAKQADASSAVAKGMAWATGAGSDEGSQISGDEFKKIISDAMSIALDKSINLVGIKNNTKDKRVPDNANRHGCG
jgi:hypothetical protein